MAVIACYDETGKWEYDRMHQFQLQRQQIVMKQGHRTWETTVTEAEYNPAQIAVIITDMWDRHWSRGATERAAVLAGKINAAVTRARDAGMLIVHAPSETMDFYAGTQARERLFSVPLLKPIPEPIAVPDYPQPVDASDGGSDTDDPDAPNTIVWSRQTDAIRIDQSRDVICGDEGDQLCSYLLSRNIKFVIYMGVHTNMCVLNRSFGIKCMLRRGFDVALVRDLTDAMYNPAMPPYVSHEEGTRLIVEYIEKHYCPTIGSEQI